MNKNSLWESVSIQEQNQVGFSFLTDEIEVDVAIIGGGITGLTTAMLLCESGKSIAVLERNQIGGITTSHSTGNLYTPIQAYYHKLIKKFNRETAKSVYEARKWAIHFIEKQAKRAEDQSFFSHRPFYLFTNNLAKIALLDEEIAAYDSIDMAYSHCKSLPFDIPFKKAIKIENQARLNPLKYVLSLADFLQKNANCSLYENTRVMELNEQSTCVRIKTQQGLIIAKKVVLATHTPIGKNAIQALIFPYRSYVVGAELESNFYPEAHLWDLESPHHSICTHTANTPQPNIMLISGNHHKVGQFDDTERKYTELKQKLSDMFPVKKITQEWSAQHYQTADALPYVGTFNKNSKIYIATGFFADGLVYGTLAARIIADTILQIPNAWKKTLDSERKDYLASSEKLLTENMNVFLQYVRDYVKTNRSYYPLQKNEAKIIKIGGKKCAAFCDKHGKLHVVSAICTHLQCVVHWNPAEETWDCPCHGSRFNYYGEVIEGPALLDLEKINTPFNDKNK